MPEDYSGIDGDLRNNVANQLEMNLGKSSEFYKNFTVDGAVGDDRTFEISYTPEVDYRSLDPLTRESWKQYWQEEIAELNKIISKKQIEGISVGFVYQDDDFNETVISMKFDARRIDQFIPSTLDQIKLYTTLCYLYDCGSKDANKNEKNTIDKGKEKIGRRIKMIKIDEGLE